MASASAKRYKFTREWLENESYKYWIEEVPNDDCSYFCNVCKKTFSCSSRVSKHAKTEAHRKNMLDNCPKESKRTASQSDKRTFFHPWLENEQFKP